MFGKLKSYMVCGNVVKITYEHGVGEINIITPQIINIFAPLKRKERLSKAIEGDKAFSTEFLTHMEGDKLTVQTNALKVYVYDDFKVDFYDEKGNILCEDYRGDRKPFVRQGKTSIAEAEGHKVEANGEEHKVEIVKKMFKDEYFYGLGDKTGYFNKRGYGYEMWNTDDPSPHVESHKSLYKSIPFFISLRSSGAFGIFFDNTFKSYFDLGKENSDYYYFGADDGNLDYYFIAGPEITTVLDRFTYLTGKSQLPQMWTLGYQQCRWSYAPESKVMEIAENFRKKDIPCDVIHLDIDYMDGYRVFTWDKEKFPEPEKFLSRLKDMGYKVVTIIDPGVKKDKGYKIYDEGIQNNYFATDKDGIPYVNEVWPGDSVYPDFANSRVREWWSSNQKIMLDSGVSGIWNDMNEPASFRGPLPEDVQFNHDGITMEHKEVHNFYGQMMSKSTYDGLKKYSGKRPFVITRACYAGIQKYSTVWTGDNQSFWEHLRMAIPMLLNLGMSGVAFAGTDVGGFGFDCTPELLRRWVQVGCFSPLFRNHSALYTREQEPWAFDQQTEDINRKYIKLRYKLLPYIYDLMWQCETAGLPVMRPLMLHYQKDTATYEINDQFMFGENILVAPIVSQGQRARMVYLPEGSWVDYWTEELVSGGRYIIKEAPLDVCPMYVKKGSIIPAYPEQNYIGEKEVFKLGFDVYPGEGSYLHYEDDKESFEYKKGIYNLYKIKVEENEYITIMTDVINKEYKNSAYKYFDFRVHLLEKNISEVRVNGEIIKFEVQNNTICFTVCSGNNKIVIK